jgi:hypothetical protein
MLEQYFRMQARFQADAMQAPSQPTPRFKAFNKRGSQMPTAPQTRHDATNSVVRFKACGDGEREREREKRERQRVSERARESTKQTQMHARARERELY